jgi:hypothetical protein
MVLTSYSPSSISFENVNTAGPSGSQLNVSSTVNNFYFEILNNISISTLSLSISTGGYNNLGGNSFENQLNNLYINGNIVSTSTTDSPLTYTPVPGSLTFPFTLRITTYVTNNRLIFTPTSVSASVDQTLIVNLYNGNADFVFVDTSLNKKLLLINDFQYIKNTNKLIYIKDAYANAQNNNIYVSVPNGTTLDGNNSFTIIAQCGCLSLYSDGINWFIANSYPSNNQSFLGDTSDTASGFKLANATINAINVFLTDTPSSGPNNGNGTRKNGTNIVNLPTLNGTPSMCIVVYGGDSSADRQFNNKLGFNYSSRNIDRYYNTGKQPYLVSDTGSSQPLKNSGIVFISDGTYWYIAGWFNGAYWAFDSDFYGGSFSLESSSSAQQIDNIVSKESGGGGLNRYFALPTIPIANPGYFRIIKSVGTQFNGTNGVTFYTFTHGSTQTNYINNSVNRIYYQNSQTNSCLWMVGVNSSGIIRWYPIIGYAPA